MRKSRLAFVCLVLSTLLAWGALSAQAQQQVTLGNASAALTGPWKFHTGDNMAWAQPGFDDSGWGAMDLTPPAGSYDPSLGSSGYVPGWTARGYKGYHGYAWYRLRVTAVDGQTALALKMPDNFDDAYQMYVNGQLIGHFGHFMAHGATAYNVQPRAFSLPANMRGGPVNFAIRMWMSADTPLFDPYAGGLHGPPVLGHASTVAGLLQLDWDAVDHSNYGAFLELAILLLALLVAFGLYWLDPKEPAYLWLGLICVVIVVYRIILIAMQYTTWISLIPANLLLDVVLAPAGLSLWVVFWAYWFHLGGMARLHRMVWSLLALLMIGMAMLRAPLYGGMVPVHAIVWLSPVTVALRLLLGVLLVWVTVRGIRKDKTEGWLSLPAVVLVFLGQYTSELSALHVVETFVLFGIGVGFGLIGTTLSLVIITVLLLRRFLHSQREREKWKQEIEQARQLQQVLIPESLPVVPGFALESEYRPAQQVGGDFFQIIAHPTDGSVLIVLGDVTGHGLQAAMMVSLLVGAVRNQTETNFDPLSMLYSLNRRLLGRGQANATCLALRLAPDGKVTLANAGHLPPYLNGREMAMEGALPLGVMEGAEFSTMQFHLQPGDRLTLLTDGVMEAQNEKRELFGFERAQQISQQSATSIAETAQKFGQDDDITVVSVVRAAEAMVTI